MKRKIFENTEKGYVSLNNFFEYCQENLPKFNFDNDINDEVSSEILAENIVNLQNRLVNNYRQKRKK